MPQHTKIGMIQARNTWASVRPRYHRSLLVRCHAPQYRHLYVLSCAGADSLSVTLYAAVSFASRSLEYMRFPDTAHVHGGSRLALSISQEALVLRCFAAITKPHWALLDRETKLKYECRLSAQQASSLPTFPGTHSQMPIHVIGSKSQLVSLVVVQVGGHRAVPHVIFSLNFHVFSFAPAFQ